MSLGSQIKYYRRLRKFTQDEIAFEMNVSVVTVCNWERDIYVPTNDKLKQLAAVLRTNVNSLIHDNQFEVNERIFNETKMKGFIKDKISTGRYPQLEKAMEFADNNFPRLRKRKGTQMVPYENHPLNMVCHAFALGLDDDTLLAATLLHDVGEKFPQIGINTLPVGIECQNIIRLITKPTENYKASEYYRRIEENPKACLVKCLSRCSNLSSYIIGFSQSAVSASIKETEKHIYPLLKVIKAVPEYNDAAFLLYYQMKTIVENLKYFL